jgi:hypothetical protein
MARPGGEGDWMDEFAACSVCARTPLIGERVAVMSRAEKAATVCDLCLLNPRAVSLGEQIRSERVRSAAGAANVRRAWPRPAEAPLRIETPAFA